MTTLAALQHAKTFPFALEEYQRRQTAVRISMVERDIDVLLISEPENMYYLTGYFTTGYWSVQTLALPRVGEPFFVVRHLERTAVLGTSYVEDVEVYQETEEPTVVIARTLAERGFSRARIGVEKHSWYLTVRIFEALQARLRDAQFVDASFLINELRVVKSPAEIEYLRQAARAAEAAVKAGIETCAVGQSEAEVAIAVFTALARHGSDRPDLGVIASGERALLTHGRFSQREMRAGDPVRLELTGRVAKYNARLMRCLHLGPPPARLQHVSDVLSDALDQAIGRMKPGVSAGEVDRSARERLRKGDVTVPHRSGYSMGILFVPSPVEWNRDLLPEATWLLQAGMVFHVLLSTEGIGHSEMVLVTDRGHEVLTSLERRLLVK
jgi:Xaa-Pro aminopeptidase